jgi:hypothetical protein
MAGTPANSMNLNSTVSGLVNWDGISTMSSTALTLYSTLTGAGANTVNNVSPGTLGQVLTSNGASAQPTYQTIPFTQMPWTDKAISFAAAVGNGYFVTATATATLPASPAQGNTISFAVDSASGILTIQANTGQIIRVGKVVCAAAGICVSNFDGDAITLVYRASDTTWISVPGTEGTWTLT